MGNAPPLREIIDMPRKIQARVEQIPQYRVLRQIVGQASWYGPGFHGRTTANGERYNQHGLTAAHPSLPFGTRIKVTNKNNGRSVVVRINDRGPYAGGRIIDLSAGAARIIGMMGSGVAPVQLEILGS
jgi:rare lipoprotein A